VLISYGNEQRSASSDPSHGTRTNKVRKALNPAKRFKDKNNIECMIHSAQSPDLNPIEALWEVLFTRVRKHTWNSLEELKAIIDAEWAAIDQSEIRKRIAEMSMRCKRLIFTNRSFVKTALW